MFSSSLFYLCPNCSLKVFPPLYATPFTRPSPSAVAYPFISAIYRNRVCVSGQRPTKWYGNIRLIELAPGCAILRHRPSIMRRKICNWWICSATRRDIVFVLHENRNPCRRRTLARRTVLKPPPAKSKICSSSRSFSKTVSQRERCDVRDMAHKRHASCSALAY